MNKKYQPSGYLMLNLTGEVDQDNRLIINDDSNDFDILWDLIHRVELYPKPLIITIKRTEGDLNIQTEVCFTEIIDGTLEIHWGSLSLQYDSTEASPRILYFE